MTTKQRKQIYLRAAVFFSKHYEKRISTKKEMGIICGFCDYSKLNDLEFDSFIEFRLFFVSGKMYWFDEYDQSERIFALLLCAEMCR